MSTAELMTPETNSHIPSQTPMALLAQAVQQGLDPAQLEKLMDLQERWERNEAEKAYNAAMVAVQRDLPSVCSNAHNTQTNSKYPTESRVREAIKEKCLEHGFIYAVDELEPPAEDMVRVRLIIRHVAGHSETMVRHGKVDMYGPKGTPISTHVQGCQKTVTYLGRRMTLQAFGVVVDGDDNDGNGTAQPISEEQAIKLDEMISQLNNAEDRKEKFCAIYGIGSLDEMPSNRYDDALASLQRALRKEGK